MSRARSAAGTSGAARRSGRRVGLRAVAEELGVSTMTVSNAYNRPDQLSAALRQRVLEAARDLGYPGPDPLARGLRRGRAGAIGLVHDTRLSYAVRDPALLPFLGGVGDASEEMGLGLLLISGSAESRGAVAISDALVDGLIVYSVAEGDPLLAAALKRRLPLVIVDQPMVEGIALVGIDNRAAARELTDHVLGFGHRRLAVISLPLVPDGRQGPADPARQRRVRYPIHRARLQGYGDALEAAGLARATTTVYECAASTRRCGRDGCTALLDEADGPPTAILAASDQLALGAMEAARERGIAVPEQLSIVGFDDIPEAASGPCPLTTVRQPHDRKGTLAIELLAAALRDDRPQDHALLDHQLVRRESVSAPSN